jgi:hypothetical protein
MANYLHLEDIRYGWHGGGLVPRPLAGGLAQANLELDTTLEGDN